MRVKLNTSLRGMDGKDSIVWPKGKEFDSTDGKIPADILAEVKAGSKTVTVLPDAQALAAEASELAQLQAKYEALEGINQGLEMANEVLVGEKGLLAKEIEDLKSQLTAAQQENAALAKKIGEGRPSLKTLEIGEEKLYCEVPGCGAGPFTSAKGLKAHMTKMHPEPPAE